MIVETTWTMNKNETMRSLAWMELVEAGAVVSPKGDPDRRYLVTGTSSWGFEVQGQWRPWSDLEKLFEIN